MASTMRENTPSRDFDSSPLQGTVNMSTSDVFPTPPKAVDLRSSSAPKKVPEYKRAASTPPEITNENYLRIPGKILAPDLPTASHLATTWDRQQLSKKRSQYYGEVFAYREPHNTAKDRVTRDSVIVAEIKLNCKVGLQELQDMSDTDFFFSLKWSKHFCLTSHFSCPRSISVRSPA